MNFQTTNFTEGAIIGSLSVRRAGQGPVLLLIHGGAGSWIHWMANADSLSRNFAVTLIDLPGFGDAPAPRSVEAGDYIDEVAESIARVTDGLPSFGLVGFSFGAVISSAVSPRFGSRVSGLSLLSPGGFGVPSNREIGLLPVPSMADDPMGHRAAIAHNLGAMMLSAAPKPENPVVTWQSSNIARMRFDSRSISHQKRLVTDLAMVDCPLQVIWGARDPLAVPSVAARAELVRKARADAEIHVVPDASHWVQYEAPDVVEALLNSFYNRGLQ